MVKVYRNNELNVFSTNVTMNKSARLGRPYSQQPGRQHGEGAGKIKNPMYIDDQHLCEIENYRLNLNQLKLKLDAFQEEYGDLENTNPRLYKIMVKDIKDKTNKGAGHKEAKDKKSQKNNMPETDIPKVDVEFEKSKPRTGKSLTEVRE